MLAQIEEFLSSENRYSPETAVKYYTKDCVLYRRVNKALRQQNFLAILDFRFFLADMQTQLQAAYDLFSCRYDVGDTMIFYRGQLMSQQELDLLNEKRRCGSLITVNSYLSTTLSRDVAKKFIAGTEESALIPAIYLIHAEYKDPTVIRRKPFAYIDHLSFYCGEELEVLFSIGSFFRVDAINFNEDDHLYEIQLTFIYDEEHLTITDDYGSLKNCSLEERILKTGDLLYNHVKHGAVKAYNFYQCFLSDNYPAITKLACQNGLGWLALKQKQYQLAIDRQEQALQMYPSFQSEGCLKYLYVTSYCCLGAVHKQLKEYPKALSYYSKAQAMGAEIIPIDKYAFSNTFSHIPLINIACIQKIQGAINDAWTSYKKLLATQMTKSTRLHGAIYLRIAEAGLGDDTSSSQDKEQTENWKRFLDFSLTDMSSTYRRSIISGVLSINLRFANNEDNRDKVIDYYRKTIDVSQKFIKISYEDYCIVIQCHQRIAEIYRKTGKYEKSLEYDCKGLNLCRTDDVEFFTMFYEGMTKTYEQQLEELSTELQPEEIDFQITPDLPLSSSLRYLWRTTSTYNATILHFARDEFAFGQCKKSLNSDLLQEPNLKRRLAYCFLKVAALRNEQNQTESLHNLLNRVLALLPDDIQIQFICNNNLAYLEKKFDQIISSYEQTLAASLADAGSSCIGEDAFCYIAYLYGRKNDSNAELKWYTKAIDYFAQSRLICSHTRFCFIRVASFYQTKNDLPSCISIYLKLAHHFVNYRTETSPLQKQIVYLIETLIRKSNTDDKDIINMLKYLIQMILRPVEDINLIDTDFQVIINQYKKKGQQPWTVVHVYESYLDHILLHITHPLTPYIQTILPIFRRVMTIYKLRDDSAGVFDVCQRLVDIILKYSLDRDRVIVMFKQITLDLETKEPTEVVLDLYSSLIHFICTYPAKVSFHDSDLMSYILTRHELCFKRDPQAAASVYRAMIHTVRSYRERCNRFFDVEEYLRLLEKYYFALAFIEPLSAFDCFCNLIDIFLELRPENFAELLTRIIKALAGRPTALLKLLTKYRCDYKSLLDELNQRLLKPNDQSLLQQRLPQVQLNHINYIVSSYVKKVERCFTVAKGENCIIECWTKCIYFILEFASEYDDYVASCYTKLNDPKQVVMVFDSTIYHHFAVKHCPNACRRYLKYAYPQSQSREELEHIFADHFYFVDGKRKIKPLEPVKY